MFATIRELLNRTIKGKQRITRAQYILHAYKLVNCDYLLSFFPIVLDN